MQMLLGTSMKLALGFTVTQYSWKRISHGDIVRKEHRRLIDESTSFNPL